MTRKLAVLAFAACLPLAAKAPKAAMPAVTDEKVDFAAGGAIEVTGSVGELNVEAWDGPGVEITVTRSTYRADTPSNRDAAKRQLDAIKVTTERKIPAALSIRTELPHRGFWARVAHRGRDFQVDYRIRVPRDTKLTLRNGTGDVFVNGVAGDIDARTRTGDIVLQLPPAGQYSFDAHCGFGGVYSDFDGVYHTGHLISERFAQNGTGPAKQVYLRVGIGGIAIQKASQPEATK
jgi:hypothetical protein